MKRHNATIEPLEVRRMLSAAMVKDLNTAPAPFGGLLSWVGAGNTVFLSQDDGVAGWELFKTDGTTGGTVLVKDIRPGRDNSQPGWLTYAGGDTIFFAANDGVHGTELWKSDGTTGGTVLVKDIIPGSASGSPGSLVNINGTIYFGANGGVWKSDGTEAGTVLLKSFDSGLTPAQLINNNGTLFFRASTVASGAELWKSDGTDVGTVQVLEMYNNNNDGFTNTAMAAMGGFVYFAGRTATGSTDLWRSDGTAVNTTKVKDLASSSSTPANIRTVGGRVYFTVSNPGSDFGLWGTDGTTTTSIFATAGANFLGLADVGGTLFFGSGTTLYSTTGAAPTTVKTGLTFTSTLSASWVGNNGVLYLPANDGLGAGEELWKSDGVTTQLVKDIEPGAGSSSPAALVPYGPGGSSGLIVGTFSGANTIGGAIWKTDGTGPGTVLVKDISPATDSSGPLLLTAFKNYLYFIASEPTYSLGTVGELYRSDGTAAGTGNFVDLFPGPTGANITGLKVFGDYMYFAGNDGSGVGKELWRTDGTSVQFVKDINPGAADSSPLTGVGAGSFYFFQATTAAAGRELWRTDGSNAGTVQLTNNPSTITVDFMVEYNGWLYYTLLNGSTYAGMFRTDGVSTVSVSTSFTAISSMLNLNGTLYISGTTTANGAELFKITSVGASPVLVKEIASGTGNSTPGNLHNVDGTLFFTATTTANGTELWKSDGTDPGTVLVKDIVLGSGSPSIQNIVSTNGVVLLSRQRRHQRPGNLALGWNGGGNVPAQGHRAPGGDQRPPDAALRRQRLPLLRRQRREPARPPKHGAVTARRPVRKCWSMPSPGEISLKPRAMPPSSPPSTTTSSTSSPTTRMARNFGRPTSRSSRRWAPAAR
jgi:ELWxxDGT repeat protein